MRLIRPFYFSSLKFHSTPLRLSPVSEAMFACVMCGLERSNMRIFSTAFSTVFSTAPPGFLRSFAGNLRWERDDGDKGIALDKLGFGTLGVERQILVHVQNARFKDPIQDRPIRVGPQILVCPAD